jgi:mannose-6-phosphate isomerase-like protein (cupin superfamily)
MKTLTVDSWVENPMAGQRTRLIRLPAESGGSSYEIEYFNKPFTGKIGQPVHFHLFYTERFEILSGKARYQLGKRELVAEAGTTVVLPPRIPHLHPWSDSAEELHVRQIVDSDPPDLAGLNACLNTGITFCGLARDGKVGENGLPGLLQAAVSARSTQPGTWSAELPLGVQRVLIGGLAVIGWLAGCRATYPDYGEVLGSAG